MPNRQLVRKRPIREPTSVSELRELLEVCQRVGMSGARTTQAAVGAAQVRRQVRACSDAGSFETRVDRKAAQPSALRVKSYAVPQEHHDVQPLASGPTQAHNLPARRHASRSSNAVKLPWMSPTAILAIKLGGKQVVPCHRRIQRVDRLRPPHFDGQWRLTTGDGSAQTNRSVSILAEGN